MEYHTHQHLSSSIGKRTQKTINLNISQLYWEFWQFGGIRVVHVHPRDLSQFRECFWVTKLKQFDHFIFPHFLYKWLWHLYTIYLIWKTTGLNFFDQMMPILNLIEIYPTYFCRKLRHFVSELDLGYNGNKVTHTTNSLTFELNVMLIIYELNLAISVYISHKK